MDNHSSLQTQGGEVATPKRKNPTSSRTGGAYTSNQTTYYCTKSTAEMLNSLRVAMLAATGYAPPAIEVSGKLTRYDTSKRNDKAAWYVAHLTRWGIVARFGNWREGYTHPWSSFEESRLPRSDLEEFKRVQHQQEQERKTERTRLAGQARIKALAIWGSASAASHSHPYLLRKQVQAHGIRQTGDRLVIPMTDLSGNLHNLQTIKPDGEKRFLSGGRKKGLFCLIGGRLDDTGGVMITEGFATAASVYEAYQVPVMVAFDSGNLLPVAQAYRRLYPFIPITLVADNDRQTPGNPGLTKARAVSATVPGVTLIIPDFPASAPANLSDFNDLACWLNQREVSV